jgi:hypothetical protein
MGGYVLLNVDRYTDVTRFADSEEEWDANDTDTHWAIGDYGKFSKEDRYMSSYIDASLKKGDIVYILYAIYSTGDSFHRDIDGELEIILASLDYDYLDFIKHELVKDGNDSIKLCLENGEMTTFYKPWSGYFESLSEIDIKLVKIE